MELKRHSPGFWKQPSSSYSAARLMKTLCWSARNDFRSRKNSWKISQRKLYLSHCSFGWWPGSSSSMWIQLFTSFAWRSYKPKLGRWIKPQYHHHRVDLPPKRRRNPKISWNAKNPNIEGERKKNAHREGSDLRKDENRARPAAQGRDRVGAEIKSCTKAMEYKALHRQDYPARQSVRVVAETQRSEIHLWK